MLNIKLYVITCTMQVYSSVKWFQFSVGTFAVTNDIVTATIKNGNIMGFASNCMCRRNSLDIKDTKLASLLDHDSRH